MNIISGLNLEDFRSKSSSLFLIQKDFTQRKKYLKDLDDHERSRNERHAQKLFENKKRKYNNIELRRKRNKISAKKSRDNMKYRFMFLEAENRRLKTENYELHNLLNNVTCRLCNQKKISTTETSSLLMNEDITTVASDRVPKISVDNINDGLSEFGMIFGNLNGYTGSTTGSASRLSLFALAVIIIVCMINYPSATLMNNSQSSIIDVNNDIARNLRESSISKSNLPVPSQGRFLSTLKEFNLSKYYENQRINSLKKETDCIKQSNLSTSVMLASNFKDNSINSHTFYLDLSGVEQTLTPSYLNSSKHIKIIDYLTSLGSTIKDKCFYIQMKLPAKLLSSYNSEDSLLEVGCRIVDMKKESAE